MSSSIARARAMRRLTLQRVSPPVGLGRLRRSERWAITSRSSVVHGFRRLRNRYRFDSAISAAGARDAVPKLAQLAHTLATRPRGLESIGLGGGLQCQRVIRQVVQEFRELERERISVVFRQERNAVATHVELTAAAA